MLRLRIKAETYGGTKRQNLPDSAFAGPGRSFPIMSAQDVRDAVQSLGRTKHDKEAVKRGIIRRARAIGATDALPEAWRGKSFPAATPGGNYAHGDGGLMANPALEGGTRRPKDARLWKRAKLAAHRRYTTTKTGAALSFAREWYERNGGAWDGLQDATVLPQGMHVKAANYSARAGQTISGNLTRGNDGKFASGSSSSEPAKPATPTKHTTAKKPKKARGGKGKKPKGPKPPDPAKAQRQAEADAYRRLRREQILKDREERRQRQAQRQVERQQDRARRDQERAQRRADILARQQAKKPAAAKPKKGGGGGGGKGKKGDDDQMKQDKLDRQLAELRRLVNAVGHKTTDSAFVVFKDTKGDWRWLAQTTTAFEDRDREILSLKALEADVARADSDGKYGPLRWWHIGNPDPLSTDAPWGPGLDLGWCDFNAMSGKTLIESGTFKNETIARWAAANADALGLSPGFFHPAAEPDHDGVFHHIRRFERSLAPKERVSNPFTAFHTTRITRKELPAVNTEQIKTLLKTGLAPDMIASLLDGVEQTEKTAAQAGVRFKEHAPADEIVINGVTYTVKAPPVAPADEEEPEAEAKADDETLLEEAMDDSADAEHDDAEMDQELFDMKLDDFRKEIAGIVRAELAPIVAQLKLAEKMEGTVKGLTEEMKAMMGGTATKTANEITTIKTTIDKLQAQLAELEGTQTKTQLGHRASAAGATATTKAAEMAETSKPAQQSELEEVFRWTREGAAKAFSGVEGGFAVPGVIE